MCFCLQISQIVLRNHKIKDMKATPRILFQISVNLREQQNKTVFHQIPPLNLRDILFYFTLFGHNYRPTLKDAQCN
jgi:hypothetical protein